MRESYGREIHGLILRHDHLPGEELKGGGVRSGLSLDEQVSYNHLLHEESMTTESSLSLQG